MQRVAESIQVITSETLQRQQIQGFEDYYRQVPSLSVIDQGPGQTQIVMRGVTTGRISHAEPQNKSTTGVYIDDIPVSSGAFNPDLALFDVQRIEVLRGPQGTLYGAGAMSGAVRILTNEPKLNHFEGLAEATVSSTEDGGINHGERGLVNIPVGDIAALRVSAYYQNNDGFIDNVYLHEKNYNGDRTYGARASFRVEPMEGLDVTLNVLYQDLNADGRPAEFLQGDPYVTKFKAPGENFAITGPYQTVKFVDDPFSDHFFIYNAVLNYKLDGATLTSSNSYFDRYSSNLLDDTYRNRFQQGTTHVDGVTPIVVPFYNNSKIGSFTNETRLASTTHGLFDYVIGGFYQHQTESFNQNAPTNYLDPLLNLFGLPSSVQFGADPNDIFLGKQTINQIQYAGFGELTFNPIKQLSFLVGLRVFDWNQYFRLFYAGIAQGVLGGSAEERRTSDSGVNPKFQANYKPTDNILIYAQAAEGFRLGGVNEPVPLTSAFGATNCGADLAARGLSSLPATYGSDSLWNYEVGFKGQTPNHRATLNVSAYQIDWKNIQTYIFLPCGYTTVVNAGKARNRGVEGEFNVSPIDNLVLGLSGSFTDARLEKTGLAFTAQPGDRLPNVPRFLFAGSADYTFPLSNFSSLYARANLQYQSDSYSDFQRVISPPAIKVPSSISLDVFAGYRMKSWELSLFIRNLTNERIVTAVNNDDLTPANFSLAPPRTIGLTGRVRF